MSRRPGTLAPQGKQGHLSRPRSPAATRAIICGGCAVAIVSVLLLQLFLLPANTALDPRLSADEATAVCSGPGAANNSLCVHQEVGSSESRQSGPSGPAHGEASSLLARSKPKNAPSANGFPHPETDEWPNTVALCALMKTENAEDVVEWLDYHRWLGVDKVFLRENGDRVPQYLRKATQQHVDSGFLDLGTAPGQKHPTQNRWHNRCSQPDLAGAFSWIAYIDLDEYLVLMERGEAAEQPDLKSYLFKNRSAAGLSLQWLLFGSSGHKQRPEPGGPLRHYSTCTGELAYQMKCMASTYHLCSRPMLGDTVHDCAYRFDGSMSRSEGDAAYPVILGDGDPIATHLTTVEAATRAAAAEKEALKNGKKAQHIGAKKVPAKPQRKPAPPTKKSTAPTADKKPASNSNPTNSDGSGNPKPSSSEQTNIKADGAAKTASPDSRNSKSTHTAVAVAGASQTADINEATGSQSHENEAWPWQFSEALVGGSALQEAKTARSLLKFEFADDLISAIPDAHLGETVCRSYSGHLNEKQHEKHKKVSQEQMLVLVHYVTRSFDDYISRKLPRPSGIYAHTFNRMSRSKSASKMSNETLFDRFEEEQHFNGQDPVCSSLINHKYAEHCCTATAENSDALDGDKTNDSEDPEEASSTDDVDPVADNEDSDADLDP